MFLREVLSKDSFNGELRGAPAACISNVTLTHCLFYTSNPHLILFRKAKPINFCIRCKLTFATMTREMLYGTIFCHTGVHGKDKPAHLLQKTSFIIQLKCYK